MPTLLCYLTLFADRLMHQSSCTVTTQLTPQHSAVQYLQHAVLLLYLKVVSAGNNRPPRARTAAAGSQQTAGTQHGVHSGDRPGHPEHARVHLRQVSQAPGVTPGAVQADLPQGRVSGVGCCLATHSPTTCAVAVEPRHLQPAAVARTLCAQPVEQLAVYTSCF